MKIYYHYTNREGYEGILATGVIRPSLKSSQRDANFGDGVYLTTITPAEIANSDRASVQRLAILVPRGSANELFGFAAEEDRIGYFFKLSLSEDEVTNFSDLISELGIDPATLQPRDIRRVYLYKTSSDFEIGSSSHGETRLQNS